VDICSQIHFGERAIGVRRRKSSRGVRLTLTDANYVVWKHDTITGELEATRPAVR
jgi:hypothetical protein